MLLQSLEARIRQTALSLDSGWHWEGPGETKVAYPKDRRANSIAWGEFQVVEKLIAKIEMGAAKIERRAKKLVHWSTPLKDEVTDMIMSIDHLVNLQKLYAEVPPTKQVSAAAPKYESEQAFKKRMQAAAKRRRKVGTKAETAKRGRASPPAPLTTNATRLAPSSAQLEWLVSNMNATKATIPRDASLVQLCADLDYLRDLLSAFRSILYHAEGVPSNLITALKTMRIKLDGLVAKKYKPVTYMPTLHPADTSSPTLAAQVVTYRY